MTRGHEEGENPFTWAGTCNIDIATPFFGDSNGIENLDWQVAADATNIANFSDPGTEDTMISTNFNLIGLNNINKNGKTQLRVYFITPSNGPVNDYQGFYSGESAGEDFKAPELIVEYSTD